MKVNELMIGDWVLINGTPRKIQAVDGVDDEIMADDELYTLAEDRYHSEDKVEGVPITPEILEKNGFDISDPEVAQYHFEEDGQRYHFSLRQMYNQKDGKPNGYSFFAFSVLTIIDYVHELQHALRLCRIKKEIEL